MLTRIVLRSTPLLALLLSACMTGPLNGDTVSNIDDPVTFTGFWTQGGVTIELQSASSQTGPFTTFASTTSASSAIPFDDLNLHSWTVDATVPGWIPAGCGHEVFVRARGGAFTALTFDGLGSGASQTGLDCIADELDGGNDLANAALACDSDDAPVIRLRAPSLAGTFVGDVTIATQADADAIACHTSIDGSVTIADSAALSISLPNLETITGDLTVTYSRDPASPIVDPVIRSVDLPVLDNVGGNLTLDYPGNGSDLASLNVGMPSLSMLGNDLSITLTTFNASMNGLAALPEVPGDLSIISSGSDYSNGGLLSSLNSVGGDITFDSGNTTTGLLDHVEQVGGSIDITEAFFPPGATNFTELVTVGGDLRLHDMQLITIQALGFQFPELVTIGGQLDIDSGGLSELLVGNPTGVDVGELRLNQNGGLSDLNVTHVAVQPGGAITVTSNGSLGDCAAQSFVDTQTAGGWSGTATISGNGSC